MNDLKEDARALFDIAREAHEPSSRDHERVLRGVLARGAIAAGVTSAGMSATAAKAALGAGRALSTLKILTGFAVVGLASGGAYRISTAHRAASAAYVAAPGPSTRDRPRRPVQAAEGQPAAELAAAPAPGVNRPEPLKAHAAASSSTDALGRGSHEAAETPLPRDEGLRAPTPAALPGPRAPSSPALAATQSFPTSPAPAVATSASANAVTLTREARALADVQRALSEGRSREVLLMLAEQNREFAGGALGQEREAARIMALCAAGRLAEGRAAAVRFLSTNAGSPVAAHLRDSCRVP